MTVLIANLIDALDYKPIRPTYAIRIRSGKTQDEYFPRLKDSPLYLAVKEYIFDDIDPWDEDKDGLLFNRDIAKNIIEDFLKYRANTQDLLVHCLHGANRSPAIAFGMNDLFNLGADSRAIVKKYNFGTWWMAKLLINTGVELGLRSANTIPLLNPWDDSE